VPIAPRFAHRYNRDIGSPHVQGLSALTFLSTFLAVSVTMIAAVMPTFDLTSGSSEHRAYPAAPGYLLPWAGGEIHEVTQGEETGMTHNGHAAYAFDFDLHYETVVAARSGRVAMVRQDSNTGGCSEAYANAANYVVIDHGDGTSALYLHLAFHSVTVKPGDIVERGAPIATSGETGLTCGNTRNGPGPHLHFQVEKTEPTHYFTQSLPVAFDDIAKDGVPQEGKSYVSGNFGRGKTQKIGLTPHRTARAFHPVATPADPALIEADPNAVVTPAPGSGPPSPVAGAATPTPTGTLTPSATPTSTPTGTLTPSATPTATPTGTLTPSVTPLASATPAADTPTAEPPAAAATAPQPADTPTPSDTPTPTPLDTDTPTPADTPTDIPADTPTDTPPPP